MPDQAREAEVPLLNSDGFDGEKAFDESSMIADTLANSEALELSRFTEKWEQSAFAVKAVIAAGFNFIRTSLPASGTLSPQSHHVLLRMGHNILPALLPSFLLPSTRKQHAVDRSRLRSTSYMDGLRGVACFMVMIYHNYCAWVPHITNGYGSSPEDFRYIQLPFLRLPFSGLFSVSVFFLLSGYVLSLKPLQLSRTGSTGQLLDNLASAVFRRAFRLFLPIAFIIFLTALSIWFEYHRGQIAGATLIGRKPSFKMQMEDAWDIFLITVRPYEHMVPNWRPKYNPHLWTIGVEYRGSILVFVLTLGLAKIKPWVRLLCMSVFIWYSMSLCQWEASIFIVGVMFAEVACMKRDPPRGSFELPVHIELSESFSENLRILKSYRKSAATTLWIAVFIVGIYLGCWPEHLASTSPGYITLSKMVPPQYDVEDLCARYWNVWAAICLMLALENLPILQRPFTTVIAQYLGKISFALYIMHVPVSFTFWSWETLGLMQRFGYVPGCILGNIIGTFMTIWVSDVFWRGIDKKSVEFARWAYDKAVTKP